MSEESPEERAERCKSAWEESDVAEDEWAAAEEDYQSGLVDAIRASMSAIRTCLAEGMNSDACFWKQLDALDAEYRVQDLRDAADRERREAEHESREFIECISGHKFHGNIWLPLPD